MLIANAGQLFFEASLLYTSSITFKPTEIERKVNPVKNENNFTSEEEPSCEKAVKKCLGEMSVAGAFLVTILCTIASLIGIYNYNRPSVI